MGEVIVVRPRSALGRRIACERAQAALLNAESAAPDARDARLDRTEIVDLSHVVSGYAAEAEKNLRRLLHHAERVEHVLVYDESDELFGSRAAADADPCVRLSAQDFATVVRASLRGRRATGALLQPGPPQEQKGADGTRPQP